MVTINGKEYGMLFSTRARVAVSNWLAVNEATASVDEYRLQRAVCMINAYNKANGINETVKPDDFYDLPNREFEKLLEAEAEQYKVDTETTIEAVPKKGKNAKSTATSN